LRKLPLFVLILLIFFSVKAKAQEKNQCSLVVIAEVKNIEQHPIGAPSGRSANYRMADYSVVEIIKGKLKKKDISVSHLILTGKELDELKVDDKVLLCLGESWHVSKRNGRTIAYGMNEVDYEGRLLLVDSGRR
jgi:hypothetical protein